MGDPFSALELINSHDASESSLRFAMRASSKSWLQFYPHRIFVQNLRLKFEVGLFARQIAVSLHIGRASVMIMGVIVHFTHPPFILDSLQLPN